MLKVFNKETASIEKVELKDLDVKKHFHLNTHEAFAKEQLESFGFKKTIEAKEAKETK
jgi:hypothetical protein